MPLVAEDEKVGIYKIVLGPYATNTYAVVNKENRESVLIDAPDEWEKIMAMLYGTNPIYIFITHAHMDHTGALQDVVRNIRVDYGQGHDFEPICVGAHLADMPKIPLACHIRLVDGEYVRFGNNRIQVLGTPGHTPGSVCLLINKFLIAGDTIFPGGPGHTNSPEAFNDIVKSITEKIFTLPDDTLILPGHGEGTTVGKAKHDYVVFASHPHKQLLCGDVEWLKS
jgi:glyoxylase-like metal-dependent hydrolase (beta-lactamase superfamily II)